VEEEDEEPTNADRGDPSWMKGEEVAGLPGGVVAEAESKVMV
jgi:hypothetical protein